MGETFAGAGLCGGAMLVDAGLATRAFAPDATGVRLAPVLRLVAQGATLRCSEGTVPSTLVVSRPEYVVGDQSIANVRDHQPMVNIASFGMCRALANPTVQAATAAAMGTLTPMPCVPPSFSPWTPGARYITQEISGAPVPALTNDSTCLCAYAGTVTIEEPNSMLEVE